MKKIRVLLLGPLPPPMGGPEVMTEILVRSLHKERRLDFIHMNTQVSRSLADKGYRQWTKAILGFRHAVRFFFLLIRYRPHVVYFPLTNSLSFNGFIRDALFVLIPHILNIAVAIHLRGGSCLYLRYKGWRRLLVKLVLSRVSTAMVQGISLKGVFNDVVPPERIFVVPNGISLEPFSAALRRKEGTGEPSLRPKILFVGKLCREKGIMDAVFAMPKIINAEFIVVGEWGSNSEREEITEIIKTQELENRITFCSTLSGDPKYDQFVSADVFLFPTYFPQEGLAVVCIEALAAGLPIVCTDHGALSECVHDGWNGFWVSKSNPDEIAARINEILSNDALRQNMSQRSRELYEKQFTLDKFIDAWHEAIMQCVARREGFHSSSLHREI
jgi:glycosyltransferase involved in cell wall biosynthesis